MTRNATDLVVKVASVVDDLGVGPFLAGRPGGGEEVDERLDLLLALGVIGEQVGHGGAGLEGLRVAEELAQVAGPYAQGNVLEDGRLFACDGLAGLVAA